LLSLLDSDPETSIEASEPAGPEPKPTTEALAQQAR
jgi:hypothetical protein